MATIKTKTLIGYSTYLIHTTKALLIIMQTFLHPITPSFVILQIMPMNTENWFAGIAVASLLL